MQPTRQTPAMKIRAKKIFWYEEALFRERVNDEIYPSPVVPKGDRQKIAVLTTPVSPTIKNKVEVLRPEGDGIIEEALKRGIRQAD